MKMMQRILAGILCCTLFVSMATIGTASDVIEIIEAMNQPSEDIVIDSPFFDTSTEGEEHVPAPYEQIVQPEENFIESFEPAQAETIAPGFVSFLYDSHLFDAPQDTTPFAYSQMGAVAYLMEYGVVGEKAMIAYAQEGSACYAYVWVNDLVLLDSEEVAAFVSYLPANAPRYVQDITNVPLGEIPVVSLAMPSLSPEINEEQIEIIAQEILSIEDPNFQETVDPYDLQAILMEEENVTPSADALVMDILSREGSASIEEPAQGTEDVSDIVSMEVEAEVETATEDGADIVEAVLVSESFAVTARDAYLYLSDMDDMPAAMVLSGSLVYVRELWLDSVRALVILKIEEGLTEAWIDVADLEVSMSASIDETLLLQELLENTLPLLDVVMLLEEESEIVDIGHYAKLSGVTPLREKHGDELPFALAAEGGIAYILPGQDEGAELLSIAYANEGEAQSALAHRDMLTILEESETSALLAEIGEDAVYFDEEKTIPLFALVLDEDISGLLMALEEDLAAPGISEGLWRYDVQGDGTAIVLGYDDPSAVSLDIPYALGGYFVTAIGEAAFQQNTILSRIYIHGNVRSIAPDAFTGVPVTISAYNGADALSYAKRMGISHTNLSTTENIELVETVLDFTELAEDKYAVISDGEVRVAALEASRLKGGDIFYFAPSGAYPLGKAFRVGGISPDGAWATVATSVAEGFDVVTRVSGRDDHMIVDWDNAVLSDGVTRNGSGIDTLSIYDFASGGFSTSHGANLSFGIDTDHFKFIVAYGLTVKASINYNFGFGGVKEFDFKYEMESSYDATVTVKGGKESGILKQKEKKDEKEVEIIKIPIHSIGIATIYVKISAFVEISAEGEIKVTTKDTFIVEWKNGKFVPTSESNGGNPKITVTGNIAVGANVKLSVDVWVIEDVLELSLKLAVEIEATYDLSLPACLDISLNIWISGSGSAGVSWSIIDVRGSLTFLKLKWCLCKLHLEPGGFVSKCTGGVCTVKFYTQTKDELDSILVKYGETFVEPAIELPQNTLLGWYVKSDYADSSKWNFDNPVLENMTLHAKWEKSAQTVSFDFQIEDLEAIKKSEYVPGSLIIQPSVPTRDFYRFLGWFEDKEATKSWDFSKDVMKDQDFTLYAGWGEYDASYTPNANSPANPAYNQLYFRKEGNYAFVSGWNRDNPPVNIAVPSTYDGLPVVNFYVGAFKDCTTLQNIVLPESTRTIANSTFSGCTSLESITVKGNSFGTIGSNAFENCINLKTVNLPDRFTNPFYNNLHILNAAFKGCTSLKNITIPEGTITIGYEVFKDCTALEGIRLPSTITTIEGKAFQNCIALQSIEFPDDLTNIYYSAFENCSSLKRVVLPDSISRVGIDAFYNCTDVQYLYIPPNLVDWASICNVYRSYTNDTRSFENLVELDHYAAHPWMQTWWLYDLLSLERVTFGPGIEEITVQMFSNCPKLKSVTIPSTVKLINNGAFLNCVSLESVTIAEGVETIEYEVFKNCTSLREVLIPNSVQTLGHSVFIGATNLKKVTLGKGITKIPNRAFLDCSTLKEVYTVNPITHIGFESFKNCTSLTAFHVSTSTKEINEGAFYGCSSLATISLQEGLERIYPFAFTGTAITMLTIPKSVTYLPDDYWEGYLDHIIDPSIPIRGYVGSSADAYAEMYKHRFIPMDDNIHLVSFVDGSAIVYTDYIKQNTLLTLPAPLTREGYTFSGWYPDTTPDTPWNFATDLMPSAPLTLTAHWVVNETDFTTEPYETGVRITGYTGPLAELEIPDTLGGKAVLSLGKDALPIGDQLTALHIPATVKHIDEDVFRWCSALQAITIDSGNTAFKVAQGGEMLSADGTYLYALPRGIKAESYTTPDGVTEIGPRAFYGHTEMVSVTIGAGVTEIGAEAFSNCYNLERADMPASLTTIASSAFNSSSSLEFYGPIGDCAAKTFATDNWFPYNRYWVLFVDGDRAVYTMPFSAGDLVTEGLKPEHEYLIPEGWYTDSALTQKWNMASDRMPEENLILYLKWTHEFETVGNNALTITGYHGKGGSVMIPQSLDDKAVTKISAGAFISTSASPIQYLEIPATVTTIEAGAISGTPKITIVGDEGSAAHQYYLDNQSTVYFVKKEHTLTFDAMGGAPIAARTQHAGDVIDLPTPIKDNYIFLGWYTNKDLQTKIAIPYAMPGGSTTLYAGYTKQNPALPDSPFVFALLPDGTVQITGYTGTSGTVNIPEKINGITVTAIAPYVFYANQNVQDVTIPDTVTSIGTYSFAQSTLRTVSGGANVAYIGPYAFAGCGALYDFPLMDQLTVIPEGAFSGCHSLLSFPMPDGITTIGTYAFEGCKFLNIDTWPPQLTTIGEGAFANNENMGPAIQLPESLESVGSYAFGNCGKLEEAYLPDVLEPAGNNAFGYGTNVTYYAVDYVRILSLTQTAMDTVEIVWNAMSGVNGYVLMRAPSENGAYAQVALFGANETTAYDSGLTPGETYWYKVIPYTGTVDSRTEGTPSVASTVTLTTLASPEILSVDGINGSMTVQITWSPVAGADGYEVYRSYYADRNFLFMEKVSATQYEETLLFENTEYFYYVRAYKTDANSETYSIPSNVASYIYVPEQLAQAHITSVVQQGTSAARISWQAVSGATGYTVYRAEEGGSFSIVQAAVSGLTADDTGLTPGKTYQYKVEAFRMADGVRLPGVLSAAVSITIASEQAPDTLAAPVLSVLRQASASSATVQWSTISAAETYELERKIDSGSWQLASRGSLASITDSNLSIGTTYSYRVRAVSGSTYSEYSNVRTMTLMAAPAAPTASVSGQTATVTWSAVTGAEGYLVYRTDIETGAVTLAKDVKAPATSLNDTGLTAGKKYSYTIVPYHMDDGERMLGVSSQGTTVTAEKSASVDTSASPEASASATANPSATATASPSASATATSRTASGGSGSSRSSPTTSQWRTLDALRQETSNGWKKQYTVGGETISIDATVSVPAGKTIDVLEAQAKVGSSGSVTIDAGTNDTLEALQKKIDSALAAHDEHKETSVQLLHDLSSDTEKASGTRFLPAAQLIGKIPIHAQLTEQKQDEAIYVQASHVSSLAVKNGQGDLSLTLMEPGKTVEKDIPLLAFEKIQSAIESKIADGSILAVDSLHLGYAIYDASEKDGETKRQLHPAWAVYGTFVKVNAQGEKEQYQGMLLLDAQTAQAYTDIYDAGQVKRQHKIVTWTEAGKN